MGLDDTWCLCECERCQGAAHYDIFCEVDGTHPPDGGALRFGRFYKRKTAASAALAGHTDGDHTTHTDTADRGGDDDE